MKKKLIVLLVCLLIQGCVSVSSYKLAPEVLTGQKILPNEGSGTVVSHKKASIFVRSASDSYGLEEYPAIVVGVYTEKTFEFSTDNVKTFVDGQLHHVMTVDELVAAIKDDYTFRAKEIAGRYEETTRQAVDTSKREANDPAVFSPSAHDSASIPGNSYKSQYDYDFKAIDASKKQAAHTADSEITLLKEETKENLKTVLSTALVKGPVPPNKAYPRQVTLAKFTDPSKPHKIKIIITALGEEHEFLIKSTNQ